MYLIDYHIHSIYSSDSQSSLYDIEELKDHYRSRLVILQGVELGQPHHFKEETKVILGKIPFDYVVGSAHKDVNGIDIGLKDYRNGHINTIIKDYLKEVMWMVEDNCFDCIGHLDLVKRYGARQGKFISVMAFKKEFQEIFDLLIANDKGIEINTSGIRHKLKDFMPNYELVKLYKEMGGKIITVGSDAHRCKHVGTDILMAYKMLNAAGFNHVTTYSKRVPNFISIEDRFYSVS